MKFAEHGNYVIEHCNDLIIVDATGPFNEQLVLRFKNELEGIIQCSSGKKWQQIIIMNGMSIFTPEAESELRKTIELHKKYGLVSLAVVYGDKQCNVLINEQLSRCYLSYDIQHEFFDNIEKVKKWIKGTKH